MDTFVAPSKDASFTKALSFDFPLEIATCGCHANCRMEPEPPAHEQLFGEFGTPARHQGYPTLTELPEPEDEDPKDPVQDLILDRDREARIEHTGRLTGQFVKFFLTANHKSVVKMHVLPMTQDGTPAISKKIDEKEVPLVPQKQGVNVWYWLNDIANGELIYTAQRKITVDDWELLGLACGIYKLIINWEFWDKTDPDPKNHKRLPMSGFDEAVAFEVCSGTTT